MNTKKIMAQVGSLTSQYTFLQTQPNPIPSVLRKMRSLARKYRNLLVKVRQEGLDWKQFQARNSW